MSKQQRAWPGRLGWQVVAGLAFVAELLLFTFLRGHFGYYLSPVLFYGSAMLLAVAGLLTLRDQPFVEELLPRVARRPFLGWFLSIVNGVAVLDRQIPVVLGQPVDVQQSDIIPALSVYVDRFRGGEVVYRYITQFPWPIYPVYLPMQWLPYVAAAHWGIDFRWLSWGLLLVVGFGAYQLVLLRRPLGQGRYWLLALMPGVVAWVMIRSDDYLFAQVVEPTIICYYFLLAASVFSRSAWLRAGAIALCLLSRFSVVFWVPFFLWLLWREVGRRYALAVASLIGVAIVGVYVVPFLSHNWMHFLHAQSEYHSAAVAEWSRASNSHDLPLHLTNGLGAAPWVFRLLDAYPLAMRVTWMQRLHLLASVGVVAALAGFYWHYGRRYDYRYFAVVGLKLYLATFYFFLQVPYPYLVSLSVLLSVFVLMLVLLTSQRRPAAPLARVGASGPAAHT